MIKIQLSGQISPTYEYVKLVLMRKLEAYAIDAQINENRDHSDKKTQSITTAIEIENYQPAYITSMQESAIQIQSIIDQILTDNKTESTVRITVPIDMSDCSMNAAHYAIQLAKLINSPIKIVHYLSQNIVPNDYTLTVNKNIAIAKREQFEASIAELKAKHLHLDEDMIQSEFIIDNFAHGIHQLSQSPERQLIILGSKGASRLAKILFGSSALNAIREADCPILVIPDEYRQHKFNKLSLALEHYMMNKEDLTFLDIFTKKTGAQLELVTITDDAEDITEWKAKIKSNLLKHALHGISIVDDNVVHGLENYLNEGDTDMLILTPKKKTVFEGVFKKSVTKKMTLNSKVPLLVLNHQCHCKEGSNCCKINKLAI